MNTLMSSSFSQSLWNISVTYYCGYVPFLTVMNPSLYAFFFYTEGVIEEGMTMQWPIEKEQKDQQ
jgi:hypothetical protein